MRKTHVLSISKDAYVSLLCMFNFCNRTKRKLVKFWVICYKYLFCKQRDCGNSLLLCCISNMIVSSVTLPALNQKYVLMGWPVDDGEELYWLRPHSSTEHTLYQPLYFTWVPTQDKSIRLNSKWSYDPFVW